MLRRMWFILWPITLIAVAGGFGFGIGVRVTQDENHSIIISEGGRWNCRFERYKTAQDFPAIEEIPSDRFDKYYTVFGEPDQLLWT